MMRRLPGSGGMERRLPKPPKSKKRQSIEDLSIHDDLDNIHRIEYDVQQVVELPKSIRWCSIYWVLYSMTLLPWRDHSDRIASSTSIKFSSREPAEAAARALRKRCEGKERFRVVRRVTRIKESL